MQNGQQVWLCGHHGYYASLLMQNNQVVRYIELVGFYVVNITRFCAEKFLWENRLSKVDFSPKKSYETAQGTRYNHAV